jgi:CheY-like chemotaxis protein
VPAAAVLQTTTATVLALEPNLDHAVAVRHACDLAQAELTLVHSKDEFLDALDDSLPDLILLPSLLPPADESQLFAHLRTFTDSSHVQVLLTPHSFASDTETPAAPSRGWRRLLTRPASPPRSYACDLHSFAERVTWALQSAEEARQTIAERCRWLYGTPGGSAEDRRVHRRIPAAELPWLQAARIKNGPQVRLVDLSEGGVLLEADTRMRRNSSGLLELVGSSRETVCSFRVLRWQPSPTDPASLYRGACAFTEPFDLDRLLRPDPADAVLVRNIDQLNDVNEPTVAPDALAPEAVLAGLMRSPEDERERDRRRTRDEVPWLSTIKLPWGLEVDLLNISRTGMLIETNSRFMPGTATEFQLSGPETNLAVSARFVRSEVAAVGPLGVKYHAAATFTRELQLREQMGTRSVASAPRAVAELLAEVLGEFDPGGDRVALRSKFSERLRRMVPAREIQITNRPSGPREGTESIYFSVPSNRWPPAVLQATFEPDYELSDVEFRLLQTAATLASVLLDLERHRA